MLMKAIISSTLVPLHISLIALTNFPPFTEIMKVNIVSRKSIKPLTPTPSHLRKHKLSFLDELAPPLYGSNVFFYSASDEKDAHINNLEKSLAETLSHFYTLAGRYTKQDQHFVDCNDSGAEYFEAEAPDDCLFDFIASLKSDHQELIRSILPLPSRVDAGDEDPLLAVQVTTFKCGGVAIAVKGSHKVIDAESVFNFLTMWSDAANPRSTSVIVKPDLHKGVLFPSKSWAQPNIGDAPSAEAANGPRLVAKRFSFDSESISRLRSELTSINYDRRVSRVVMISALITKALIDLDYSNHGRYRTCFVTHIVNLRERTIPPIPKNSCGNFGSSAITEISNNPIVGFEELVSLIRDSIRKTAQDCAKVFDEDGQFNHNIILDPVMKMFSNFTTKRDEVNVVMFTDWSKFGFYELDFGFGKPVLTSLGTYPASNCIVLMGNKDGDGIDAWVQLNENDMHAFEQHEDIKIHATI